MALTLCLALSTALLTSCAKAAFTDIPPVTQEQRSDSTTTPDDAEDDIVILGDEAPEETPAVLAPVEAQPVEAQPEPTLPVETQPEPTLPVETSIEAEQPPEPANRPTPTTGPVTWILSSTDGIEGDTGYTQALIDANILVRTSQRWYCAHFGTEPGCAIAEMEAGDTVIIDGTTVVIDGTFDIPWTSYAKDVRRDAGDEPWLFQTCYDDDRPYIRVRYGHAPEETPYLLPDYLGYDHVEHVTVTTTHYEADGRVWQEEETYETHRDMTGIK
jgi:hypothetical protein